MGRVITNPTGSVVDASEVKILYESNENTNAYTDGDKASLGEVKDAIDMAKKVVEITFLLNDWTSNSDGTYSQTVNNSEIKSSMNPDLISMLSSGATPEEQKAYMKNFSILCQGVGNTADGSVTYKIYKQMTGDITVGLTRLGGVRQIESEAKVDDVKVGGVSVVKDKVAEIPEIPNADEFVPYDGATKNINLGSYGLLSSKTESGKEYSAGVTPTVISAIFKSGNTVSSSSVSGQGISFGEIGGSGSFFISMENNTESGQVAAKLSRVGGTTAELGALEVASPSFDNEAATKKYVDDKVSSSGGGIFTTTRSFSLPDIPAGDSIVLSQDARFPGKEVIGIAPYSGNENIIVTPTFWNTSIGFTKLTVRVTNIGNESLGTGYGCGVNITLKPVAE